MPCTTILVGKKASYDGSTMIARNDDSPSGQFTPKKFVVVHPEEQPKKYESVLSHVEIDLPEDPMRYTAVPNALDGEGIWAAHGVNAAGVGMTATETITSNARVLGADPLVEYVPAKDGVEEISGGIGEEDIVSLVLPYIHSAREGVTRLGSLLEKYGTYEMNGIAFSDKNEIWWLETIGGHHWIARRVPDDAYVVMPNQFGIDAFDLEDALTEQKEHMCSADLKEFIEKNYASPITLQELSASVSMSPKYFCRFFSEMTHQTPMDYLNRQRIEQACCQLATTDDSITEIAYRNGFNDLSYFIRTFKKYKGITPGKYKRR